MKTKITDILSLIRSIPTYLDWYWKGRRIQNDFNKAKAEWERIGGFQATAKQLLDFLDAQSLHLVEYATWTPIEFDDMIAKLIRNILTNHRDVLSSIIVWVQHGYKPSAMEFTLLAEDIHRLSDDECGSPMTALYIISILYHALLWLKSTNVPAPDNTVKPDTEPSPVRRPVRNLIRKLFERDGRGLFPAANPLP